MKTTQALLSALVLGSTLTTAQDRFFDSATSGTTWDNSTTANWGTVTGGPYTSTFVSYANTIFEGTAGTINVSASNQPYVNWLNFTADGYILNGGTINMGNPGGINNFNVTGANTATINSDISQPYGTGIQKIGTGTLILGGTVTSTAGNGRVDGGTLRIAGGAFTGNVYVADSGSTTGTLEVSGGSLTSSGQSVIGTRGNATLVVNGGAANFNGGLYMGFQGVGGVGNTTVNLSSGTLNVGGNFILGQDNDDGATSIFNQTGGTFNGTGSVTIGNFGGATSVQTMNVSAGTFNASNTVVLAIRGNATINISGTGTVSMPGLQLNHVDATVSSGTVNLDGGSLNIGANGIYRAADTGTFNFNGGTLRATNDSGGFMTGLTRANVRDGGARIDTQTFNATVAQVLAHSDIGGDAATDGGLTKSGGGILTLTSGANTYTGATAVNQGVLDVRTGVNSVPAASAISIAGGAGLTHTLNGATIANTVSGTGTWTLNVVSGAVNNYALTGANSGFSGTMNIGNGARLVVGTGYTTAVGLPGAATVVQVANGGAVYHTGGSGSMSNPITINGDGVAEGAPGPYGALRVDGGSTYSGNVTLGSNARIGGAGGHGTLTGGVTIGSNTLTLNTSNSNLTFNGNLTATAAGAIVKTGNFSVFLAGDNSGLNGTVTVAQSNLFLNSATAASATAAWVVNAGNLANTLTGNRTYELGSLGGAGGSLGNNVGGSAVTYSVGALGTSTGFAGNIVDTIGGGGTTALAKVGGGTLTLTGTNGYSGGTTISGGALQIGNGGATGTLGSGPLVNNASLIINRSNALGISTGISGSGTLTQAGSGTTTLSGGNTYAGTTYVNSGALVLDGSTDSAGRIDVSSGASLGGSGSGGNTDIADGGFFEPGGASDNDIVLTSLTLSGSPILRFNVDTPSTTPTFYNDFANITGALVLNGRLQVGAQPGVPGAPYDFTTATGGEKWLLMTYTGALGGSGLTVDSAPALAPGLSFAVNTATAGSVFLTVVPEAGTAGLFAMGLLVLRRLSRS